MKSAGLEHSGPAFFNLRNAGIGSLVMISVVLFLGFPLIPALCVDEAETGELITLFNPAPEQGFHVAFTHSVNRTEVREYYAIHDGGILLTRAEYSSFGAGMPEVPETPGGKLTLENGVLRLDHIDLPMRTFVYRIGTIADHTLHLEGRVIPFKTIAPPQTALRFQYRRVSAYVFLRRLNRSE